MSLSPGAKFGPYRILAPIGVGGMGEVYRGRDTRLDRDVALKILSESAAGSADRRARFEREARAVAALNHPNIVSIYDVGSEDGVFFIVSELVDGESLRHRIRRSHLGVRELLKIAVQLAMAWVRRTRSGSSIAISSPRTSCSRPTAGSRSSTSDWPAR
jgi:serine/threonine protein kinase